jgi:acetyl esterase/lipase
MLENRDVLSRFAPPPDLVLRYGRLSDHVADVWLPPGDDPAPLVVMWHGGFWRSQFDRSHLRPFAADLASRGVIVVTPEYRRTGAGGGWPTTFTDVADAADRLPGLITAELAGRTCWPIVFAGHSAGAQLAVWALMGRRLPVAEAPRMRGEPGRSVSPDVSGVLALAGVLDLVAAHRLCLDDGAVEALLSGGPDEVPERFSVADPMTLGTPPRPVVLVHGDADGRVPLDFSVRYAGATGCRLFVVPEADHFALIDPRSAAWPTVLGAMNVLIGH